MEKKKKLIILGVIILILAISGLTYAILTWTSSKINIGLTSGCFTIDYTKGQDISGNLKLLNESDLISNNKFTIKNGIGISAVNIGIKSTCTIEGYGSIYLNVTNISEAFTTGDSKGALKYAVLSNTSTITTPSSATVDSLLNQSFDIVSTGSITSNDTITLLTKQLSNTEVYKYLVVIYVDNALAGNSVTSASFTGNISADAEQGKYVEPTPDYCFTLSNKDETNKTATLGPNSYNCYEGNNNGFNVITDIVVPSNIDGYAITKITGSFSSRTGPVMFLKNGRIDKITLPDGLLEIGDYTFYMAGLLDVIIPNSVTTIGTYAFSGNALTSVILPDSLTKIENKVFEYNELTSIAIPNSVTTIGTYAFNDNALTSITIPDSVTTIGNSAFSYNDLKYVLINSDSKLTSIGARAFSSSKTTSGERVDNPNLKTIYNNSGKAFDWNKAVNSTSGAAFVTGTTNAVTSGSTTYNAVTVTTGQPS